MKNQAVLALRGAATVALAFLFTLASCGEEASDSYGASEATSEAASEAKSQPAAAVELDRDASHSADDGHGHDADDGGHGADDGHGHGADDGHGHGADDGHGHDEDAKSKDDSASRVKRGGILEGLEPTGAQLVAKKRDHHFGEVLQGQVIEHVFSMANEGTGDLIISKAKPTCGCTVGKLTYENDQGEFVEYVFGDPLSPGTRINLEAKLDTRNKTSIAKSKINVFSNDEEGLTQLSLEAKVGTYFVLSPDNVNFGNMSLADTRERSVKVTGRTGTPFLLTLGNIKTPAGMTVALEPVEPDGDGRATAWTVDVKVDEGKRPGRIGFPLQLKSDEAVAGAKPLPDGTPQVYMTSVMISGNVADLISFKPSYLSFGLLRPGQVASRTVRIEVNDEGFVLGTPTVRITGARKGEEFEYAEYFSHTITAVEEGRSVDVELTLDGFPMEVDGSFQGRLVLETGHPAHPEFYTAFSGVVRGGVKSATGGR